MLGCGLSIAQVAVRGIRGAPAPVDPAPGPDNVLLADNGDFLTADNGDYLEAA